MTSEYFDSMEQETKELLPEVKSSLDDDTEDTNRDPEGVAERNAKADIALPDWYFRKHAITDDGKPTFNVTVVGKIMEVFDAKFGTDLVFKDIDLGKDKDGNDKTLTAEQQQETDQENII